MILPPNDAKDFFRIIKQLDAFLDSRLHMMHETSLEARKQMRAAAFADPAHFEAYAKTNPHHLSAADMESVIAWQRHGIDTRFLILQERKDG